MTPSRIILKPKLRAPLPRPEQLVRSELLESLGANSGCKMTLVSAPAGYGKTTLLAQWRLAEVTAKGEAERRFAWVSLDEQDNDPVRLWTHIVEAVRQVEQREDFGAGALAAPGAMGQDLAEVTLPLLVNSFADLSHEMVMVLDDYQMITQDGANESVAYFLEHLPDNVHLVLASRSDPPLPLGRLRVMGEMNEIRTEQLAFSAEDATRLLNGNLELNIDPADIRVLLKCTEGWPAGLYLAALSLQKRKDAHAFVESFGGSNRYLVDLLGEEVIPALPEEEREFLLKTSILSRMSGPLCDAVTGTKGSGKLLRELARRNLFVVPLDENGEWYRYHQLFSQFLFYELKSARPELLPILHGRASVWLESEHYFDSAVRHATATRDYERAGKLIARHWYEYVTAGHVASVEGWLESLPEEMINGDAVLLLVKAWICMLSGRREEAERSLALAERIPHEGPLPDGTVSVEAGAAMLRAVFGLGGIQRSLDVARRVAEIELEQTSPRAALIRFALGSKLYFAGEKSLARRQLEVALELSDSDQPLLRMIVLSSLSIVASDEGHLREAESLAEEARTLVDRFGMREVPQSTWVPLAFGHVFSRLGRLSDAQNELESALSARRNLPGMSPWPAVDGLLTLAEVRTAIGDRREARETLAEARAILEAHPDAGILTERLERQERKLRPRKARDGSLDEKLTQREQEVLVFLVGELSTREIAQHFYVAPSTVRTQIKSIYRKLGVSSRKEAVEAAHARELI